MFHVIQDAYAIVRNKRGVYRQVKVYKYKGGLYAGMSSGYVRLMRDGDIGAPDASYVDLHVPGYAVAWDSCRRLTLGAAL